MDGGWRKDIAAEGTPAMAARLARAVDATQNAIVLCDALGRVDWVNSGFTSMTGYVQAEVVGRSPGELLRSDGADPKTRALMAERIAAQEGFRVEVLNQTKDGRRFWADLDVRPTYAGDGTFEGFIGVMAESLHGASFEQTGVATPAAVRSAAQLARVGGWDIDLKTGTVRWGRELYKLLGRPAQVEEMFATVQMYAPEERQRIQDTLLEAIRENKRVDFEARIFGGDGEELWLRVMGEPEFIDGVCVAIRGASQDITPQRRVTEQLREQQRFAQGVVDGVAALVLVVDEAGDIIAANKAFQTLGAALRGTSQYPMGDSLFRILSRLPGAHGKALERGIREVIEGRETTFTKAYRTRNGEWYRMSASRFAGEGPVRCVIFTQSIDDIKRSEKRLRELNGKLKKARDEADAANAAKSAFLATMSHEIRTPLNGVLGMAQAMARDELPPAQRDRLTVIRHAGETLLALLNDLLDLSRIEAGRLDLEDGVFDLARLLTSVQSAFKPLADEKGLSLDLDLAPEAQGHWRGDPARVRQILNNLASNAVKFTAKGEVRISASHRKGALIIEVRDTGTGIAPERLGALFEKFVQADASTTRKYGGSGLGLAICRELASLMGGGITAESAPGEGATFTLRLPLERASIPSNGGTEAIARPLFDTVERPSLKILAVDDNAMNQLVLRTLLDQIGVEVHIVGDGAQAVSAWESEDWSAILMDVQMPVMDGPTATRLIREAEAAQGRRRTPIIALTANAMAHHEAEYLAAGMDALAPKPIELERLLDTLETVLG